MSKGSAVEIDKGRNFPMILKQTKLLKKSN